MAEFVQFYGGTNEWDEAQLVHELTTFTPKLPPPPPSVVRPLPPGPPLDYSTLPKP